MGCLPVHEANPQALASGLSHIQVDNPWYNYFQVTWLCNQLFYNTYISVDLAQHRLFHAKVGKGGIKKGFNLITIASCNQ